MTLKRIEKVRESNASQIKVSFSPVKFFGLKMVRAENWEDLDDIEEILAQGGLTKRTQKSAKWVIDTLNKFLLSNYKQDLTAIIEHQDQTLLENCLVDYFVKFRKEDGTKPKLSYLKFHLSFIKTTTLKQTKNRLDLSNNVQFPRLTEFIKG